MTHSKLISLRNFVISAWTWSLCVFVGHSNNNIIRRPACTASLQNKLYRVDEGRKELLNRNEGAEGDSSSRTRPLGSRPPVHLRLERASQAAAIST